MEGMAAIFENHFFPIEKTTYEIPYDLPYLVSKSIYPEFASNILNVFCLCDISLMYFHSGEVFVKLLQNMKEENIEIKSYNDIYSYALSNISLPDITLKHHFRTTVADSLTHISNIVNSKYFIEAKDWIKNLILKFFNIRNKSLNFLASFLEDQDKESALKKFLKLMSDTGTPLIWNDNGDSIILFGKDKENPNQEQINKIFFWRGLQALYSKIFLSDEIKCNLNIICNRYNDNCDTTPWVVEDGELCLFNQIYKMWGLSVKSLVKKG